MAKHFRVHEVVTYFLMIALAVSSRITPAHTQVCEEGGIEARIETGHGCSLVTLAEESCHPWYTEP